MQHRAMSGSVETPRSARTRKITEDVAESGREVAADVLATVIARKSSAQLVQPVLEAAGLTTVEKVLNLAGAAMHPDDRGWYGDFDISSTDPAERHQTRPRHHKV